LENTEGKIFEMRNGVLYRKANGGSLLFCVPEEMEEKILNKYQNELDKVIYADVKTYWFSNMKEKVVRRIGNCLRCVAFLSKPGKEEGLMYSIPKGIVPFEIIHIDHYGPVDNDSRRIHQIC